MTFVPLRFRVAASLLVLLAAVTAVFMIAVARGCREVPHTSTKQVQQNQLRQADHGEALLKAAASQLNDLPRAVDTELRPPVVLLDSRKSTNGQDVLATCSADPKSRELSFNVIRVPAGNSRFRSLGVRSGDILKYYVLEDKTVDPDSQRAGLTRQVAMEMTVAQVLDDNTLLIESGLNQEVPPPGRKIEIWRYVDDRLMDIHEKLTLYEIYRKPAVAWEPAPDGQVLGQVMDRLTQWIRQSDPKTDWVATTTQPLIEKIDESLRSDKPLVLLLSPAALAARAFQPEDAQILQEAVWLRDISRWVRAEQFDDVSRAAALFDWTVRNIQLEADEGAPPRRPWHALLYGHGTARQRAWVFSLLCRQQGLDVVMLAIPPATHADEKSPPKPASAEFWLPALVAEGQLYLFDTRLGLPISGPGGKGVATLEQVRKDDSLLRQLDIEGNAYPVNSESLKSVEVDLVADPFALSRRASQMDANLSGEDRLVLAFKPTELTSRLKSISGIAAVRLWDFPFETLRDQLSLGKSARHRAKLEFEPFAERPALWKARTRHFQGRRQDSHVTGGDPLADALDDHEEAARLYMSKSVRPTDREIAAATSENERRIASTAKLNAAYWLGLMSFDDGKYSVAASWFARPKLLAAGSPWMFGAAYNLARSLEAQDKFDEAIPILERDTSPQQHGNKLRARMLKSRPKESKPRE